MRRLKKITFFLIYGLYLPISLFFLIVPPIANPNRYEFIVIRGDLRCVEDSLRIQLSIFGLLDTLISLFCVIILASPLANPAITRQIRGTVLWNSTFAVIAIVSTAASLLYFIVDPQPADNIESNGIEGQSYTPFFLLSRNVKKIFYTITSRTDVELAEFVHTGDANVIRAPRATTVFVTEPVTAVDKARSSFFNAKRKLSRDPRFPRSPIPQQSQTPLADAKEDEHGDETNSSDGDVKNLMRRSNRTTSLITQSRQQNIVACENYHPAAGRVAERSTSQILSSNNNEIQNPRNIKQRSIDNYSRPESISASSTRGSFRNIKL
mmetsp:Transcript_46875/g.75347  ORF Transcript_46875/g.75347 Transcript_46875/m.75347 type:complete len:323 (+) Transcript_46875:436-1404(+)